MSFHLPFIHNLRAGSDPGLCGVAVGNLPIGCVCRRVSFSGPGSTDTRAFPRSSGRGHTAGGFVFIVFVRKRVLADPQEQPV